MEELIEDKNQLIEEKQSFYVKNRILGMYLTIYLIVS
jgi:hypothetical protein